MNQWVPPDQYEFQAAERPPTLGMAPAQEFPFVDQPSATFASSRALKAWQESTATNGDHPYRRTWLPHYANKPPPGYDAPVTYGLYGPPGAQLALSAPVLGRGLKLALGALGAWLAYQGLVAATKSRGKATRPRREGTIKALIGAGLIYYAVKK